jgi:hypothetical protein
MAVKKYKNLPGEEWKLIEGTEDIYVSNMGRVRRNDRIKKIQIDDEGYCRVNIGRKKKRLHRVVAEAFVPNPNNYPVVDHLDNNKRNCRADNLEWVTHQENTRRAAADGLIKGEYSSARLVLAVDPDLKGYLFPSQSECATAFKLDVRSVNKVIVGKQKTTGGYQIIRLSEFEDKRIKSNNEDEEGCE